MSRNKEIFLYLVFGVLTTVINIVVYYLSTDVAGINYKVSTTIAWAASVLFAFFTNKTYVFQSDQSVTKELLSFTGTRIFSYVLDISLMILLVEVLLMNDLLAKIAANVVVVISNYVLSKYVVFKKSIT